ncbi:DUF6286 domain-containing protein [Streptomyces sp. 4N509B]|uniref:DUF6286 domain-containing protein n=1 Tax=Streptomyces sp. 4N509B TaxID=3457413 RepID=UPI003FD562CC
MAQSASAARYEPRQGEQDETEQPAPRFWSVRRVPATVVGVTVLGAVGLLLYDVTAVRAERPAAEWRRTLADELASRPLDDGLVVLGALAAVVLGAWLVVLAVTPGLRGLLPMRSQAPTLRSGVERRAAAVLLRDRAMDVSGVQAVRVSVGRRRVRVAARAHFRDLDEVRSDLDAVLDHGIGELGLARPLALSVDVRRPEKEGR